VSTIPILETLNYVKKFSGQRILIKLGGSVLDDQELINQLCADFSLLRAAGISLVIVHGGSRGIEDQLRLRSIQSAFKDGLRVTTTEMMHVIEMVLCGQVNRNLVRNINASGVAAIGLSGTDNWMLRCDRLDAELGEVGKVVKVDTTLIERCLLDQEQRLLGHIPVIAPIGVDDKGNALNVNADWAATVIAQALNIDKLIYLTDQSGIYDAKRERISEIDRDGLQKLIDDEVVKDGMLTKVRTIMDALDCGLTNVHIVNAKQPHSLIEELFTDAGIGTLCRR
jgi:acetylglutamate kinase